MGLYIHIDKAIRSYKHIVADGYITYNSSIDSYPHLITDCWHTFILATICLTYHYTLMNITIAIYFCRRVNCNIIYMTKVKTTSYIGLIADFNTTMRCYSAVQEPPQQL